MFNVNHYACTLYREVGVGVYIAKKRHNRFQLIQCIFRTRADS